MAKVFNQIKANLYNPTNVFKGLHCIDAGYYNCDNEKNKGFTISIDKSYYTMVVVAEGGGLITFNGKKVQVERGSVIIVPPCSGYSNRINESDNYKFFYLNFEGEDVEAYFRANEKIVVGEKCTPVGFDKISFSVAKFLMENKQETITEEKFNRIFFESLEYLTEETGQKDSEENYINKIVALINEGYENPSFNINTISEKMHLSHSWLCALFKKKTGVTMQKWLIDVRLARAKDLVLESDMSVSAIAFLCGFNDALYFSSSFKKNYGLSPSSYRIKHKNSEKV